MEQLSDSSDSPAPIPGELSPAGKALLQILSTPKGRPEKQQQQQLKMAKVELVEIDSDEEFVQQVKAVNDAVAKSPKLNAVMNELLEGRLHGGGN